MDLATGTREVLKSSSNLTISSDYFSIPEMIAFPTSQGLTASAWYYPPKNPDYTAPNGELPPLLVKSHGQRNRQNHRMASQAFGSHLRNRLFGLHRHQDP